MSGRIIAAISVSPALQYMDDVRVVTLRESVRDVALAISRDFGYGG